MTHMPTPDTLVWRLHADKLMLIRHDGIKTAMLGFQMVASWFNHTPPNSLDIEYVIQLVEDALMPLKAHLLGISKVLSNDVMLLSLCQRLETHDYTISKERIEEYFEEVCFALNRPQAWARLQMTQQEIAYLLVLREAVHHLDLPSFQYQA